MTVIKNLGRHKLWPDVQGGAGGFLRQRFKHLGARLSGGKRRGGKGVLRRRSPEVEEDGSGRISEKGGPTVRAWGGRSSWRWRRYGDLEAQVSHGIERGG
jgi:hypothetical protein